MLSPVTFAYVPAHTSRLLSIHTHRVCPHLMEVSQNIARIGNSVLCLSTWLMLIRGVVEKDSSSYCVSFDSSVDCRVSGQRGWREGGTNLMLDLQWPFTSRPTYLTVPIQLL